MTDVKQILDGTLFREVLGSYPTGVCVITARDDAGGTPALVVGSCTSISMDPPLVGFFAMKSSHTYRRITESGSFCINVLAADQEKLSRDLAQRVPLGAEQVVDGGTTIIKRISGALAYIECDVESVIEIGDHDLVVGRVRDLALGRDSQPLLYFQRSYGKFATASLLLDGSAEIAKRMDALPSLRVEIERIASLTGFQVTVGVCVNGEYVVVADATGEADGPMRSVGRSVPMRPPFGALLVDSPYGVTEAEWLRPVNDTRGRADAASALARVRERGWSIAVVPRTARTQIEQLLERYDGVLSTPKAQRGFADALAQTPAIHDPQHVEIGPSETILHLSVPVRDRQGDPIAVLRLNELTGVSSLAHIEDYLRLLAEAADRLIQDPGLSLLSSTS